MRAWVLSPFHGRPTVEKVVSNIGWLVFERLVPMATGFAVNTLIVRYLGPSRFGLFSYAISFASIFASLTTLGMDPIITRDLTRSPDREGEIVGTALVLRLVAAVVLWSAAVLVVMTQRQDALSRILVAILATQSFSNVLTVFEAWYRAHIAARTMVLARTSALLLGQLARAALVLLGAALPAFAIANAGTMLLSAVVVALLCLRQSRMKLSFSAARTRQLARDSWPLVIVGISIMVYMKIDQVMLTEMAGERENGIYATAVSLSEIWFFLPLAVAATLFPLIVRSHDEEAPHVFRRKLQLFYDGMIGLSYSIAIPIFLLAGPIVRILYGGAYADSVPVLRVHILSFVFVCVGVARSHFLVTKNYNRFSMTASVLAAVLNVALNLLLIPRYGALGAAWATLLAYGAGNYASGLLWRALWEQTWLLTRSLAVPFRVAEVWRGLRKAGSATSPEVRVA